MTVQLPPITIFMIMEYPEIRYGGSISNTANFSRCKSQFQFALLLHLHPNFEMCGHETSSKVNLYDCTPGPFNMLKKAIPLRL